MKPKCSTLMQQAIDLHIALNKMLFERDLKHKRDKIARLRLKASEYKAEANARPVFNNSV